MTASAPPPRPTRQKLIDAAFVVVARDGLEGASVKAIAAEAGVTAGLTHYHFPTRDALLEAALRQALERYLEDTRRRREATATDSQVQVFFGAARAAIETDLDFFRVRLAFAAAALSDATLAVVMRDLNAAAIAEAALTFAAARGADGASGADFEIAATLKAAFDGLMLAWLNDPSFPLPAAGDFLETATRLALANSAERT
jgi:TetR/AcrR family transcriptional repressor of bet genes